MKQQNSSLVRETFMGVLGGLGAAYLMGFIMEKGPKVIEQAFPQTKQPETEEKEEPATVKAAEGVTHLMNKEIPEEKKPMAGQMVHYLTGATLGAIYGLGFALMGQGRKQRHWYMGPLYGVGVWLLLDEFLVPALKLSQPPQKHSISTHATALGAHLAYGTLVHTALTAEEMAMDRLH